MRSEPRSGTYLGPKVWILGKPLGPMYLLPETHKPQRPTYILYTYMPPLGRLGLLGFGNHLGIIPYAFLGVPNCRSNMSLYESRYLLRGDSSGIRVYLGSINLKS